MRPIILDQQIVSDEWLTLTDPAQVNLADLAGKKVIVHLNDWPQLGSQVLEVAAACGIQVNGDCEPEAILDILPSVALVAIHFPTFADGRGYSLARLLRERHGFKGVLRATGDVLRDQLFYLHRCGFNCFVIREDRSVEDALNALKDFSVTYQADTLEPRPIYHRMNG